MAQTENPKSKCQMSNKIPNPDDKNFSFVIPENFGVLSEIYPES